MLDPIEVELFPFVVTTYTRIAKNPDLTDFGWYREHDDQETCDALEAFDRGKWFILGVETEVKLGKVAFGRMVTHRAFGSVPGIEGDDHDELVWYERPLDVFVEECSQVKYASTAVSLVWNNTIRPLLNAFDTFDAVTSLNQGDYANRDQMEWALVKMNETTNLSALKHWTHALGQMGVKIEGQILEHYEEMKHRKEKA